MKRRLNNIFREDGKSVVLAIDHGASFNVLPEMENPGEIIEKCAAGGIDAILTSYGVATNYQKEIGNLGLILRADGGMSQLAKTKDKSLEIVYSVESALRIGADAMLCMSFPGSTHEDIILKGLSRFICEASQWNMPICAEALPRGFEPAEDSRTGENIAFACRQAVELGADFIKTAYTGDKESFKQVVDGCYKPVLVLGGNKPQPEKDILQMIKDSIDVGAKGVIIGRNIWRHEHPDKYCAAINAIVHHDATVEQALEFF